MRWSEDQTLTFVKIYLQHEYLWNTKHEHYGQKYLRKKAYSNISSLFEGATGIKLMEREVMLKLRSLGSTYTQEMTKIKRAADAEESYKPAMKWFRYWYSCKHDNQPIHDDFPEPNRKKSLSLSDNNAECDSDNDGECELKSELNESHTSETSHRRWSEEDTLQFVRIYSKHPILWNRNHKHYAKNQLRTKAYHDIRSEFKAATGISLKVRETVLKIRSLKSTYAQAKAKIKRKSNCDYTYVPRLRWFADWHRCHSQQDSSDEQEIEMSELENQKVWLNFTEDDEKQEVKSEETHLKTKWGERDTLKFVKIYLQYEFLYNPKHKYFRQKKLRQEAYSSISTEFEAATGIKLDEKEMKTKIKILGSTYGQELTKIKKRSGTDNPYSPNIKWFHYWHKYKHAMQQRNAGNAVEDAHEPVEEWSMSTFEEEPKFELDFEDSHIQDSESECEVKANRMKSENQDLSDTVISPSFVDINSDCAPQDEFEHYGKYVASVLRSMDLDKALQTQLEIQNLLSSARMKSNRLGD